MIASLLVAHGIKHVVVSPGSRNAPLLIALERQPGIETHVVIDERSAAFIALGMSVGLKGCPVALVCTSGTAPLNYAPALAEAFYRHVPLIAFTADRPEEWIDQDDSQTIVQPGIFSNFIKGTFDIPVESDDPNRIWMINRKLNDALLLAASGIPGPVHINVRLDEPLGEIIEIDNNESPRLINSLRPDVSSITQGIPDLTPDTSILVIAGFLPENNLSAPLRQLAGLSNVVILHEAQSNLHGGGDFIPNIDATLSRLPLDAPPPRLVITIGGSLTSRKIKAYLRNLKNIIHWSVGERDHAVDCFKQLSVRINTDCLTFLNNLIDSLPKSCESASEFKRTWFEASKSALRDAEILAENAPWSDFQATEYVMKNIPEGWDLQIGNGTSVRYAQLFGYSQIASIHCNRGVSGIDGCTSTAIGAAFATRRHTLLLTGDMGMQYDIGALATPFIPPTFKIVVLNNGGGGIFRFIPSTRSLPELQKYFVADVRLPLAKLSEAYGFEYYSAKNLAELKSVFGRFIRDHSKSVLEIFTDGDISAKIISRFLENT